MKKFLEISGFVALLVAIVGFVLMMATPAIVTKDADVLITGTEAIFGSKYTEPATLALLAWIFGLLAILVLAAALILPLLKVKVLDKYIGFINLGICLFFVLVGIFMFCVRASWANSNINAGYIGAGWVIGGILFFVAGGVLMLPAILSLVKKK